MIVANAILLTATYTLIHHDIFQKKSSQINKVIQDLSQPPKELFTPELILPINQAIERRISEENPHQ